MILMPFFLWIMFIFFLICICCSHVLVVALFLNKNMQLKDEYKNDFARDMGLFGGLDGFKAWMTLNTYPICLEKVNSCVLSVPRQPHVIVEVLQSKQHN
jgi:hypothetical protein